MTRAQFLNDLYRRLAGNGMDKDQAEQHLTYYAEMLADRMEEGMSEDAAVASMEDVDTIARRILEEEGKTYRPPEAVAPPGGPDISPNGGRRAYQVPKKWGGRRLAQAALWALAIVIALGACSRWLWRRNVRSWNSDRPIDTTSSAVRETAPIPDTPSAPDAPYIDWDYALELPYESGYAYASGINEASAPVKELDIRWAAGTVYIQSWTGDRIQFQEYAHAELNERSAMLAEYQDDKLSISYRSDYSGTSLRNVKGDKYLVVLLPDGMLEELDIETASADVQLLGLEQGDLDVSTASGDISATECYTQSADLNTISGDIALSDLYTAGLDLGTTSGDLYGTVTADSLEAGSISGDITLTSSEMLESASLRTTSGYIRLNLEDTAVQSIDLHSVSGDISLGLPFDLGFALKYSTVSGSLNCAGFEMLQQDGKRIYNGGGCEITAETVSGNLDLY